MAGLVEVARIVVAVHIGFAEVVGHIVAADTWVVPAWAWLALAQFGHPAFEPTSFVVVDPLVVAWADPSAE